MQLTKAYNPKCPAIKLLLLLLRIYSRSIHICHKLHLNYTSAHMQSLRRPLSCNITIHDIVVLGTQSIWPLHGHVVQEFLRKTTRAALTREWRQWICHATFKAVHITTFGLGMRQWYTSVCLSPDLTKETIFLFGWGDGGGCVTSPALDKPWDWGCEDNNVVTG